MLMVRFITRRCYFVI